MGIAALKSKVPSGSRLWPFRGNTLAKTKDSNDGQLQRILFLAELP